MPTQTKPCIWIVSGSSGSLGRALVDDILARGDFCFGLDKRPYEARIAPDAASRFVDLHLDVLDESALKQSVDRIKASLPREHARAFRLISALGSALEQEFATGVELPAPSLFEASTHLNLNAHYRLIYECQRLLPEFPADKSIVLVSSINAIVSAGLVGYSAAKSGLLGLTKAAARPLEKRWNTRINAVILGSMQTVRTFSHDPRDYGVVNATTLRGSILTAPEAASFITSTAGASGLSGQALVLDAGQSINFPEYF